MFDDEDDDECMCTHPEVCTCVFELDWMTSLREPLYTEGFRHGFADGSEQAVHDTIYRHAQNEDGFLMDPLPWEAYVDPCRYKHAYSAGYQAGYLQDYRRHRLMMDELNTRFGLDWFRVYYIHRFRRHDLFEGRLADKIEKYVWTDPKKPIK